jgi:hypothetical protein
MLSMFSFFCFRGFRLERKRLDAGTEAGHMPSRDVNPVCLAFGLRSGAPGDGANRENEKKTLTEEVGGV